MPTNQSEKSKVLLVEDEEAISDLYKHILVDSGFEVITAHDGVEGLALAQKKPDLILLDIMLPKMNGIEVLKQLKKIEETKKIPVVLVTNLGQPDVIQSAFDSGAQGYILKARTMPMQIVEIVKKFLADPNFVMEFNLLGLD